MDMDTQLQQNKTCQRAEELLLSQRTFIPGMPNYVHGRPAVGLAISRTVVAGFALRPM